MGPSFQRFREGRCPSVLGTSTCRFGQSTFPSPSPVENPQYCNEGGLFDLILNSVRSFRFRAIPVPLGHPICDVFLCYSRAASLLVSTRRGVNVKYISLLFLDAFVYGGDSFGSLRTLSLQYPLFQRVKIRNRPGKPIGKERGWRSREKFPSGNSNV